MEYERAAVLSICSAAYSILDWSGIRKDRYLARRDPYPLPKPSMKNRLKSLLPPSLWLGPDLPAFVSLAGCVAFVLLSIWISEMFLVAAILAAAWHWTRDPKTFDFGMSFIVPLGFFFAWTMVAAFAAGDNPLNRHTLGKFYLLLILVLASAILRGAGRTIWIYKATFIVAALATLGGLLQFITDPKRDLMNRITGFQSTWMNYSGQLMLVLVALSAYAFCYGMVRRWWIPSLGLLVAAALVLSYTRNAWMGAAVGIVVVALLLGRLRFIAGMIAMLVLFYLVAPPSIQHRFQSGFNPEDPNTANRIEVWKTSMRLIRAHPWVGVGPESVRGKALHFRGTNEYPDWLYQHMLNNFLQIAAERGLPGLLLWLWFMGRLAWDAFRVYRRSRGGGALEGVDATEALMASTAALGAWAAFIVAGLFEYNFGSSVVMILFLFIIGAPYAFLDR
jgi:putative inorganic carbon (hco3(-)) transporter